jgi:spore germination protein YaaH
MKNLLFLSTFIFYSLLSGSQTAWNCIPKGPRKQVVYLPFTDSASYGIDGYKVTNTGDSTVKRSTIPSSGRINDGNELYTPEDTGASGGSDFYLKSLPSFKIIEGVFRDSIPIDLTPIPVRVTGTRSCSPGSFKPLKPGLIPNLNATNLIIDRIFGEDGSNRPDSQRSIMQVQSEEYSKYNFTTEEQWDSLYRAQNPNATIQKTAHPNSTSCNLTKVVYGWNPYWISASQYNNYNYSLLSDLCYFSYEVNASTGGYSSIHNWTTSGAVNNAQAAGCRVSLCATLFSNHNTFLGSASSRQNFISTMISLLQARNANGVNIDFEGMGSSSSANFTQFMIDLCTQMHAAIPGSKVSIAMPSVDWSNVFDEGTLNPYVDYFIIMGYDYHWGGGPNAGPVSPLYHGNYWSTICCDKSMAYYLAEGVSPNKLCLGVPYYGYDWPTSSNAINSTTTASGTAVVYYTTKANAQTYGQQWDNNSATPYYMYNSGGWHQAWYDDETSLSAKYDKVNQINIGGIGIWALGYDDGYTACWDAIRDKFTDCIAPQGCSGTITDLGGPGNYFDNEDWSYTIAPPNANQVTLTFSSFALENNYDFLYVYDGPNTASPLIGTYTGSTNPGTLTANSGRMTLRFTSDVSTQAQGFNATWNCVQASAPVNLTVTPNPCPVIGVTLNWTNSGNGWYVDVSDDPNFGTFYNKNVSNLTSTVCPGSFCDYPNCTNYLKFEPGTTYYWRVWNGSVQTYGPSFTTPVCTTTDNNCSGTLDDSGGPSNAYSGNEDYTYVIAPTNAATVTMNFTGFDLENNFDSLYIHDGSSTAAPLIGAYTGLNSPGSFTSTGGAVTLHFISDPFVNNAGFTSTWTCTPQATGVHDEQPSSSLQVYPNPFTQFTTLQYELAAGTAVRLTLVDLLGQEILLEEGRQDAGTHSFTLDAKKHALSPGLYFISLRTGETGQVARIIIE